MLEKDVNLQIGLCLKEKLEKNKIEVIMTREDDCSLANSKMEDLKKRVELINNQRPDLAVSIHQNSYTAESVKGAQVFYHTSSVEGKKAAGIVQKELIKMDTENTRVEKAENSYYLLKNTKVPLVIVECGFLSNKEEAEKLKNPKYQEQIAQAIADGVIEYLK